MGTLSHGGLKFGRGAAKVALFEGLVSDLEVMSTAGSRVLVGAVRGGLGSGQARH